MQVEETSALVGASQPERIRAALLQAIEIGELQPGDAVDEKELADRFGVSRTPVREALLTLAAQHLVCIVPRSGIHVHAPDATELVSMLEALSELEAVVARLCALRMDPAQRDRLRQLNEATGRAAVAGDRLAYETHNEHFHDVLYEGCGNAVVVEQVRQLRLRLAAFRRRVRDQPGRLQSAAMEHDAVVAAIVDNDAERAAQAMREHIIAKGRAFADLLLIPASTAAGAGRRPSAGA
jgi:DNA-binding GntR family transcriptional regulator